MCACVSLILCKLKIYFLCFFIFLSDACCLRELRSDAMMFMNGSSEAHHHSGCGTAVWIIKPTKTAVRQTLAPYVQALQLVLHLSGGEEGMAPPGSNPRDLILYIHVHVTGFHYL